MPKFSVIIPVYNCERLIKQCIESFIKQDFDDYEIIAIDDCSIDKSLEVLNSINSNKLIVVEQPKNGGSAVARNKGIELSKGEYLWFVDADDAVTDNAFIRLNDYLDNNLVDVVVFDYFEVDKSLNVIATKKGSEFEFDIVNPLEKKEVLIQTPCGWNKVFKKELFNDTDLYFLEGNWFEDFATVPRILAKSKRIGYLREPLYLYVQNDSSKTHTQSLERNLETIKAMDSISNYYLKNNLFDLCFDELQFLASFHSYRLPSVRIIKEDSASDLLIEFKKYVDNNFGGYENNKYNSKYMSFKDKVVFSLLNRKKYYLLSLLFKKD